jgi:hypothetical protein
VGKKGEMLLGGERDGNMVMNLKAPQKVENLD